MLEERLVGLDAEDVTDLAIRGREVRDLARSAALPPELGISLGN
jgi:hypothetical protein